MEDKARNCFRDPIPEIFEAAQLLNDAVTAHLKGDRDITKKLIIQANIPAVKDWGYSIWRDNSPYVHYRKIENAEANIPKGERQNLRMPTSSEKRQLLERDGYHCRFCGIPLIRTEVRQRFVKLYPDLEIWSAQHIKQHTAFQTMWVQYDHILPHSRGGGNELSNLVIACHACNYGRDNYTLDEVNLVHPLSRNPISSTWDGLERFK